MSWEGRFLSKASKELLLKTVAQALPNHAMSVFLLPLKTCKSLESIMSKYWCQSSKQSRRVSWMSWNKLCRHKHKGGLGFKDLRQHNIALLGKQAWRLLVHDSTLVSKVFKARYFPNGSFLSASLGNNPSYVWRSIFEAKDLIMAGARRSIASGIQTSILGYPWLPDVEDPYVHSIHPGLVNQTVASLIIPLPEIVQTDCWSWSKDCTGLYSVKSAYGWLQNQTNVPGLDTGFWKVFWKIKVQPKVLQFAWRALTDTLATKVQLTTKHVYVNKLCIFCNMAEETIMHVLVQCPYAMSCWHRSSLNVVSTVLSARTHLYQWQNAQQTKGEPPLSHFEVGREAEHWTKPTESMVKVNMDGATFEATNAFGYGFISRDTNGEIIEARYLARVGILHPKLLKCWA
uniref:Reverse transcriptase zinc-binding domain-containing protein n=1 Tax=Cannabis sativa TaxID=3483 RepID=A0A803Q3E0_CANSA